MLVGNKALAQLLQIEISLKPGFLKSVAAVDDWDLRLNAESVTASLEANLYLFNGIVSVGGFYEKSFYSTAYGGGNYTSVDANSSYIDYRYLQVVDGEALL